MSIIYALSILSISLCLLVSSLIILISFTAPLVPKAEKGQEPISTERLEIVIVTIADEQVWPALKQNIEHTTTKFSDYNIRVLTDEGADMIPEIKKNNDVQIDIVPESFETSEAGGKGRAIEWFCQNIANENTWYSFIDDDNIIKDKKFLYEIPVQEQKNRYVMNPILVPRLGDSVVTFSIDHIRTLFDLTVYKLSTGTGYPVLGLHGELLTVRGDVLKNIGFDRETIAEDFAFADRIYNEGIKTWQSRTKVSILSPHSLKAFAKQRRRWSVGQFQWLPHATITVQFCNIALHSLWSMSILTNYAIAVIYFTTSNPNLPTELWIFGIFSTLAYTVGYSSGLYRAEKKYITLIPLIPIISTIEQLIIWVIIITELRNDTDGFTVINK